MSEAEILLEHANVVRKLASDMASQHLTLMLVGDGSPMNNLVRDTVGANRRSMEEAADHLQRLARESRLRPPRLTLWQFVLRLGLSFAVGITIAPFTLMALFWAIDQIAPPRLSPTPFVERDRSKTPEPSGAAQPNRAPATDNRGDKRHGLG
ncbi:MULTISPECIES: hypothetical protein [unclassified Sphingomonas]|uniref:hypothetical protein n=1 Tax=unclassified Sphingomonas TaxID=196159 RepID=UPI0022698AE3|nr:MULTISPECIES: hypothetical protein [unclassified Sphingomonas]